MKITVLDRFLLLLTGLLAAWQVSIGLNDKETLPMIAYTISFGILLIACLLLIILGWDALDSPMVVIVSTIIPLGLSLGLVWENLPSVRFTCFAIATAGFLAVIVTRMVLPGRKLTVITLAVVHGLAGLTIFLLPILFSLTGRAAGGFSWVGIGGALIGVGGLLLALLKTGKPILSRSIILKLLPGLLLLMTASFVIGFSYRSFP